MQKAAQAYIQTSVTTRDQGDILVMLYDGAIKFMNMAKERLAANDMAGKGINITKALNIIEELLNTLDIDKGGPIAENLRNLYTFCTNRLVMANIKKSPEMIDEVIKIVTGLRAAFAAIVDLPEAREASQQVAAGQRGTGVLQSRPQPGITTTTAAATPGAGARMRSVYAQSAQGQEAPVPHEHEAFNTTEAETHAQSDPLAPPQAIARAASQPAPSIVSAPMSTRPETEEAEDITSAFPAPPPGGFGAGRLNGSAFYKKVSQQQ